MKNSIVIVDPEGSGWNIAKRAKEMGRRIIICVVEPAGRYNNGMKEMYHIGEKMKEGMIDLLVREDTCEAAAAKLKEISGEITGIIPGSEVSVEVTDKIASELGLIGNDPETSMNRRNKYCMKQAMKNAGIRHARGDWFDNLDDALRFAEKIGYPVVAKPTEGASGQDVFICRTPEELCARFRQELGGKDDYLHKIEKVLVEEFIEGDEYAVNMFSDGTRLIVTDIWKYKKISTKYADNVYYSGTLMNVNSPEFDELKEYARNFYRAVGLKIGPAHAEIKSGPKGICGIEIGGRLAGGNMGKYVSFGEEIDLIDCVINLYEGREVKLPEKIVFDRHIAYADLSNDKSGIVKRINGISEIEKLESFFFMELNISEGSTVSPTYCNDFSLGLVWLKNESLKKITEDIDSVHRLFQIETE